MTRFKLLTMATISAGTLLLSACVGDDTGTQEQSINTDNFDFIGMMTNYADNIIMPNYQSLSQSANSFAAEGSALANYCTSIGTANEASNKALALSAWQGLQESIQRSELHILGPVLDNGSLLLDRINPYNNLNLSLCGIDQAVVLADQNSSFDIGIRSNNQRGIGTLEYLLFNETLTHSCPSQITETTTWDARSEQERRQLRCNHAKLVATDLASNANQLAQAWTIDGSNYRSTFINPSNTAASLSALSDALFYIEIDVKDRKLGIPTGINNADCSTISCAENVESPYAEISLTLIRQNLLSFQNLYSGATGLGFDDIVTQAGVSDLNTRINAFVTDAVSLIDSMNTSLRDQAAAVVTSDDEAACTNAFANPTTDSAHPACNLFGLLKLLTDELKIGFVAAVNVDLPDRVQSDND